jgi:hypothetical protein
MVRESLTKLSEVTKSERQIDWAAVFITIEATIHWIGNTYPEQTPKQPQLHQLEACPKRKSQANN